MRIGVFALQGAFAEHEDALRKLGAETVQIRRKADFAGVDGVVLVGGESTVQGKLLKDEGLFEPLRKEIAGGMPAFGTCAGLILLAKKIVGDDTVWLGNMDIEVRRNAYGRQLGSFRTDLEVKGVGNYPAVFIRAPYIERLLPASKKADKVEILAETGGHIVAARQGHMLATAFHPELTDDLRIHAYFLDMVRGK